MGFTEDRSKHLLRNVIYIPIYTMSCPWRKEP